MSSPVNNIKGLPCLSDGSENWQDFINTVTSCYNKIPADVGAGYYEMYGQSKLLVRKPEYVTQILKNNVAHYLWGGIAACSVCFFGDKVMFVVEDEDWRQLRRVMSPELRSSIDVGKFISDMQQTTNILVSKLEAQSKLGAPINLISAVRAFHLSSAGRAMFNVNLRCVESYPESNSIADAFSYFLQELPRRSFSQDESEAQDYTTPNDANKAMWKASKAVHDIVLEVVKDRFAGNGLSRKDMLNEMVNTFKKEHGKNVSPEQVESALGANLVELLFAGYNTVVNTIASAIYLLSTNPHVLQKVLAELDRVLGSREVSKDDVDKLTFLDCVFKETLRLYPPAPAIARRLQKDEILKSPTGDLKIPKDAEVMFAMSGLHKDAANWKDPEKFMPERFQQPIKNGTFVPFSDGPRSCIGQHFARLEFLVTMSTLLRKFDFTPASGYKFGMVFNGFGWMAADMGNPWGGSCVNVCVASKGKSSASPSMAALTVIGLQVAAVAYALYKKSK